MRAEGPSSREPKAPSDRNAAAFSVLPEMPKGRGGYILKSMPFDISGEQPKIDRIRLERIQLTSRDALRQVIGRDPAVRANVKNQVVWLRLIPVKVLFDHFKLFRKR